MSYEDAPTLRPQLRALVREALAERLGAEAAVLDPDAEVVAGDGATVRRIAALEALALDGCRVLDLGTGVGDLARAARRRGAELVDAVDRDPASVQLARLLCVLQGVDRVSCFEGDAALASTYADEYDAILAPAPVLDALRPILPRVVQNLRGPLLAELPAGDGGAAGEALAAVLPARRVLVEASGADGIAVVACASEHSVLRRHLASPRRSKTARATEGARA